MTTPPPDPAPLPAADVDARLGEPIPDTVRSGSRILGIDVARALAIIGMVMVHFGPRDAAEQGLGGQLYALTHGRASILFVLLAGVGAALLAGHGTAERVRTARWRLAYRAAVLLPLGLALQPLDHGVLVILHYYAVYFLVAALALRMSDRLLLGGALLVAVLAPVGLLAAWRRWPEAFEHGATVLGDPALVVLRQLLLTGSYPTATWAAPLLLGLWAGRRDLRDPRVQRGLLAVGAVVAVAAAALSGGLVAWLGEPLATPSWRELVGDEAHSQMPLWLIGGAGSACAVLGAALVAGRRAPRAVWPVAAAGQLAFTIYVGHLLVLHRWRDLLRDGEVAGAAANVAWFTLAVVAAATGWRAVLPRGPLEEVLRLPWSVRRALAGRRS